MATNKTLLPPPYLTLEDENGATIIGGTVTFLDTGTAVLAVVYADADGAVVSANPLTVDGSGRYTVFLTPGQVVDVEYRDANGALVKTVPGVQAVPSASGSVDVSGIAAVAVVAGQLVFLSDGTAGPAGQWALAHNQGVIAVHGLVGVVLAPAGAGSATTIRTSGRVTGLSGLVVGALYYLSISPGQVALSPLRPSIWSRLVGQADTTTSLILHANPPELAPADVQEYNGTGDVVQFIPTARTVRLSNLSLLRILGIKGGYHGQRLRFINAQFAQVDFINNSPSAVVEDRLYNTVGVGPTSLCGTTARGWADYEYDASSTGWRLIAHEQGGYISPPFNAGSFGAGGGMTWTVAAGEVVRQAYLLRGNTLTLALTIYNSTLGGVASGQLFYTIPAGYTSSGLTQGPALAYVPGTGPAPGVGWQTSGQTLVLSRDLASGGAWPVGTGLYYAAVMVFEVQ